MRGWKICRIALMLCVACFALTGRADDATGAGDQNQPPKTIDQVTDGFDKLPGLFTFYIKAGKGQTSLLMEVNEAQIGQPFFMQSTFGSGNGMMLAAGMPIQDFVLAFQRIPDGRLLLTTPNLTYRATAGTPIAAAVKRGFPEGYLAVFPVVAEQPERNSLLIDVGDFFTGDVSGLSALFSGALHDPAFPNPPQYALDEDMTFVTGVKSFPENDVVEVNYHFARPASAVVTSPGVATQADPRSLPVKVVYNLWRMPAPGYRPRLADLRVGYFVNEDMNGNTGFQQFNDDTKADPNVYYITRWRLQKTDPLAAVSPARQPIVFWIDNDVPEQYRQAVRDGILQWNPVFARIGISDAIVVKQMPVDADWDAADMRYNTIHWAATPLDAGAASLGLLRQDPITGEIVNASIIVDAGLTRVVRLEDRYRVEPANLTRHDGCAYAQGLARQAWYGWQALVASGNPVDENAYVDTVIREFVGHEMGHVLGLRHNFMASTFLTPAELSTTKGTVSASLMDYNPFNIFALDRPGVPYYTAGPGVYDERAIAYGYTPLLVATPEEELPALRAIAAQTNTPGMPYASDELVNDFDPAVVMFDLSADPLAYSEAELALNAKLLTTLAARLPAPGEGYRQFTLNLLALLEMAEGTGEQTARYIGGYHVRLNDRGDLREQPPLTPVPAAQQYRALRQLNTYIFSGAAFNIPKAYYTKLVYNPFQDDLLADNAFPMRDVIGDLRQGLLASLFAPDRLSRIANGEFVADGAFRMVDLFTGVSDTVWAPLATKTAITPLQRDLQNNHLDLMIDMAVGQAAAQVPPDARTLARTTLRNLRPKIATARTMATDQYTRVHLDDALARIDRALAIPGAIPP